MAIQPPSIGMYTKRYSDTSVCVNQAGFHSDSHIQNTECIHTCQSISKNFYMHACISIINVSKMSPLQLIHYSTIVSFILGLSTLYFWCTSFRLLNCSKSARVRITQVHNFMMHHIAQSSQLLQVTIKSLINSRVTKALILALMVAAFAYVGIVLLTWVLLGLFHPYVSRYSNNHSQLLYHIVCSA